MSRVFRRRVTTYTLPNGKYRTPDGRRVTKDTPGAVAKVTVPDLYYGNAAGPNGKRQPVPLCADKSASKEILRKIKTDAKLASVGLRGKFDHQLKRAAVEHLADYRRHLEAKGDALRHVAQTLAHCRAILEGTGAVFLSEVDASRVTDWLAKLRSQGASVATSNHYLRAVKSFLRWCVADGRLPASPLAHLATGNVQLDRRRVRRPLSADELRRVIAAAGASGEIFRGLTGRDRAALYTVAAATGFRAGELGSLTPDAFNLDGDPPTATLAATNAKNGKTAVQPLPPDVADFLREYLRDRLRGEPVWPGTWAAGRKAAKMLRIDLDAAGVPYVADGPSGALYVDFHSLRHAFIALLDKSGATLKEAMQLARHSDPKLTMAVYGRAQLHDLGEAVGRLPCLVDVPEAQLRAATGTEGGCAPFTRLHHFGGRERVSAGPGGTTAPVVTVGCHHQKSPENIGFGIDRDLSGAGEKRVSDGIRTRDSQIHSLEL